MSTIQETYENLTEEERRELERKRVIENENYRIITENTRKFEAVKDKKAFEAIKALYKNPPAELDENKLKSAVVESRENEPDARVQTIIFANFARIFSDTAGGEQIINAVNNAVNGLAEIGSFSENDYELNLLRERYSDIKTACEDFVAASDEGRPSDMAGALHEFADLRLEAVNKREQEQIDEFNSRMKRLAFAYKDAQTIMLELELAGIHKTEQTPENINYAIHPTELGNFLGKLSELYPTAKAEKDEKLMDTIKTSAIDIFKYFEKNPELREKCGKSDSLLQDIANQFSYKSPVKEILPVK